MKTLFSFGNGQSFEIDLADKSKLIDSGSPCGDEIDDPAAAVAAALGAPLRFPAITEAIMPSDLVAVAIGNGIPQVAEVVAGTVHALLAGESIPSRITLVVPEEESRDIQKHLPKDASVPIEVVRHDPHNSKELSYLAASHEGHAIYLNRSITDADLVIPIGTLRPQASPDYWGMSESLFPTFSDATSLDRYHALSSLENKVLQQRRREEADEAAWLLGVQLILQVLPGPGDSILQVLASERSAIEGQGQSLCEAAWHYKAPQRSKLVVALLEGEQEQQSWISLARAARAATDCVEEGGTIILCSSLTSPPTQSMLRLGSAPSLAEALSELRTDHSAEAMVAGSLAHTMERAHLYLLSELTQEVVEGLGMGYVSSVADIQRLVDKQETSLFLREAARIQVSVAEEKEAKADAPSIQ